MEDPWYFVHKGQQEGPVGATGLVALAREGIVSIDSLVWKEGMEQWGRLRDVAPDLAAQVAEAEAAPGAIAVQPAALDGMLIMRGCSACSAAAACLSTHHTRCALARLQRPSGGGWRAPPRARRPPRWRRRSRAGRRRWTRAASWRCLSGEERRAQGASAALSPPRPRSRRRAAPPLLRACCALP